MSHLPSMSENGNPANHDATKSVILRFLQGYIALHGTNIPRYSTYVFIPRNYPSTYSRPRKMFESTVEIQLIASYVRTAALMLTLYEYCLTLSLERELIWRRKMSVVSVLFLINRYALILQSFFNVVNSSIWMHHKSGFEEKTCTVISWLALTFQYLLYLVMSAFSVIRAYAIWDGDKRAFVLLPVIGLVMIGCSISKIIEKPFLLPIDSCLLYTTVSQTPVKSSGAANILSSIAASCSVLFEIVAVVVTWMKTVPTLRLLRSTNTEFFPTLVYIMYRDGTLSFIAILLLGIFAILSYVSPIGLNNYLEIYHRSTRRPRTNNFRRRGVKLFNAYR
ncbi:hypothetical protein BDY19DRAFT_910450 [Irpex rosettiformis]|uniref:Uncharacterized protein n=1 Tax=Irpex rosettiformis TaxID=378272 RepID=A0ACB8TNK6_9APHY|nr:hypothetical protein BDY19DRAFT_910450 [Irpex rosettiformis]